MIDVCKRTHKNHKDRGDSQMKNRTNQRLEEITVGTLIVGVDVAKSVQWALFVDYRGVEVGKAISFQNNRQGFERIVARMQEICNIETLRYVARQPLVICGDFDIIVVCKDII